ncbi:hypothetical protein PG993_007022 [Apiospora rasikravindrae]|uniref:Uncharacterized protein n=1 Tax=Apiospora rasikravindrae TaxID=990691 RepID=A0ABR1SWC7_9PEZI
MGAYVSVYECRSHYNVTINCDHQDINNETQKYNSLGEFGRGQFSGNPDVAGIGIVGVFIGVTCFALAVSAIDGLWQVSKTMGWKTTRSEEEKRRQPDRISFTDILESLVLTSSDQQIFTGAAYALTLRYWQGCKISAYHYNIVGNMMLISCATHLMSVTVVRHYWQYPILALLRVFCVTGVFIVTGLLMVNQNAADPDIKFPTEVPPADETDSLLLLPAACFETARSPLQDTLRNTTASVDVFFKNNLNQSTPGNTIHGWNWYIILLLFYLAAIIAEAIRYFRRNKNHAGWRGKPGKRLSQIFKPKTKLRKAVSFGYLTYLAGGVVVSSIAVIKSIIYIFQLRDWVAHSGWMETDNGINPENDWSSFGQLVPIFMSGFILFNIAQVVSEKVTQKRKYKQAHDERPSSNSTAVFYSDPTQPYSLLNSKAPIPDPRKLPPFHKSTASSSNASTPQASNSANSAGSTPQLPGLGLQNTSPLLDNVSSVVSPPPQSAVAAAAATTTPPRPLTSRFSSGYFSAAAPVSPPTPTPAASSRPSSGTYAPLAQQDDGSSGSPGHPKRQSRVVSGVSSLSAAEGRRTSNGSWTSSSGGG